MRVELIALAIVLASSVGSASAGERHPPAVTHVTCTGEAPAGQRDARQLAIADALRNAVMKGVGVYVDATTIGRNYQVIQDEILLQSSGFVTLDEVRSTSVSEGILRVEIKATVTNRPLVEKLNALRLRHEWKIGVYLPESYAGGPKLAADSAAETEIARTLTKNGFRVIDEARWNQPRDEGTAARAAEGDPAALKAIRKEYDVDILVTGGALAEYVDEDTIGGVRFYRTRGRIAARAYYTDTGELLSATDAFADGLDQTEDLAAQKCLKDAGLKVSSTLAEDILVAPASLTPFVTVKIAGFKSLPDASAFEKAVKALPGVTQVKRQRYSAGVLELSVYVKADHREALSDKIEASRIARKLGITIDAWGKVYLEGKARS